MKIFSLKLARKIIHAKINNQLHVLESYGIRVQKSAFECHLDNMRITALKNQLKKFVVEGDCVRIYQVKDYCFDVSQFDDVSVYSTKTVIV